MKILVLFLALFGLISSAGASLDDDLQVSSLMQKKQHHEVVRILQAKLDRKEPISSFQLFLLAGAYSEIRNYGKIIVTADLLAKQIKTGDSKYFSGDLTAYPMILRALAALDQGDYGKAVTEATAARTCLGQDGQGNMFIALNPSKSPTSWASPFPSWAMAGSPTAISHNLRASQYPGPI